MVRTSSTLPIIVDSLKHDVNDVEFPFYECLFEYQVPSSEMFTSYSGERYHVYGQCYVRMLYIRSSNKNSLYISVDKANTIVSAGRNPASPFGIHIG